MTIALRWTVSSSASCFYAADMMRRGRDLAGAEPIATVAEPAKRLHAEIEDSGLPAERLWRHLVPLSARVQSNRELVQLVLRKTIGMDPRAEVLMPRLAGRIADVEAALRHRAPRLVEELTAWSGALRNQWDVHGGAVLGRVGRVTDERLIVPNAEVVLVYPATGGGGTAHLLYNSVSFETMPTDPRPQLPEVVRLAWLLAQLNIDLPLFSETIHHDRHPLIAGLAMVPAVLSAAEELDLARCDSQTLQTALETWHLNGPENADLSEVVLQWWTTYVESRPAWNVALTALDRMVP